MAAGGPKSRVKLSFECTSLVDKDWMSKSDPIVLVLEKKTEAAPWSFVGRTEYIKDNQNPAFKEKVTMDYTFERKQFIQIIVLDIDDPRNLPTSYIPNADETDLLGMTECMLSEIVSARNCTLLRDLTGKKAGKKYGKIKIVCEQLADTARSGDTLVLDIRGVNLAAKDGMFGKSDPYLIFKRQKPDGTIVEVCRTEIINQNLNPSWKQMRIDLIELCNGNFKAPIIIECWDYDAMSTDDNIGDITTTVEAILNKAPLQLKDRQNRPQLLGKCGDLAVSSAKIFRLPSFLDYISMGCEVSLSVAVDFTLSNGAATDPTSLHHVYVPGRHTSQWNEYQAALIAVGEILVQYDSDHKIAAFGFGGIPPGQRQVSFCFNLNGQSNAEVDGVQGLLDAYAGSIQHVELYGPTNMADVIRRANLLTKEMMHAKPMFYNVLLIITDGDISDFMATVDAIVESSHLPISIVIVGVRNQWHDEKFASMKQLDGDEGGLVDSKGMKAVRDVVQFVCFDSDRLSQEELASQVLGEIPGQVVQYFTVNKVKPASWSLPDNACYELLTALPKAAANK